MATLIQAVVIWSQKTIRRDGAGPAHTLLGSYFICTKLPVCCGVGAAGMAVGLSSAHGECGELSVQGVYPLIY